MLSFTISSPDSVLLQFVLISWVALQKIYILLQKENIHKVVIKSAFRIVVFSGQKNTLKINLVLLAGTGSGRNHWTWMFERPQQTLERAHLSEFPYPSSQFKLSDISIIDLLLIYAFHPHKFLLFVFHVQCELPLESPKILFTYLDLEV